MIQLLTFTARWMTRSRNGPMSEANAVVSTIATVPTRPPTSIERRVDSVPFPTITASAIAAKTIQVNCSCVTTQSACCNERG